MHSCPFCGLPPHAKRCVECSEWFVSDDYDAVRCSECAPEEEEEPTEEEELNPHAIVVRSCLECGQPCTIGTHESCLGFRRWINNGGTLD